MRFRTGTSEAFNAEGRGNELPVLHGLQAKALTRAKREHTCKRGPHREQFQTKRQGNFIKVTDWSKVSP